MYTARWWNDSKSRLFCAQKVGFSELGGGKIPIVGIAAGFISKGISKAADMYEGRKGMCLSPCTSSHSEKFCEELTVAVTKAHEEQLNTIGTINSAQPKSN